MAEISVKTVAKREVWENFLGKHPEANFLQSWYWGEVHQALGKRIHRVGFYKKDQCAGVALMIVENAKRGWYVSVPGGPIIDWSDADLTKTFVTQTMNIAKQESCIFIRVRPQLVSNDFSKEIFAKFGFVNAPMHMHAELTSQLLLGPTEDELLMQMRKSTRYEIKKALSMSIRVTTTDDPSSIKEFYDLQLETAKRQNFVPFSYRFFYEQFKVFSEIKKVLLYTAKFKNLLLGQAFIIFYGQEAVYHYGASTESGRKYPGAYLIQWEAIKEAKNRGLMRYNFWGIAPENQKNHRFYGVSVFKRGFGGEDVEYLHAQDLIVNKPKYLINFAIEQIRKKIRDL